MRSITILALEIYQKLGKQYPNLTERKEATKQYILNEITQWGIKTLSQNNNYFYKPGDFLGDENSSPFEVRLVYDPKYDLHELKFGNLNANSEEEQYKWDDKDPYRLQKALFLNNVLESKILPLFENNIIKGIMFMPYEWDGLGSERLSYFRNMFDKLGKDKVQWKKIEGMYFIYKKTN
jgi:hypothetical protein